MRASVSHRLDSGATVRGAERFHPRLETTVTPCVTCGRPVFWMAQHRECWQWERANGITPETLYHDRHRKVPQLPTFPTDLEYQEHMERFEAEAHAYAASH